jgi:hypothetical protein
VTAPGRRGDPQSQGILRGAALVAVAVILGSVLLAKGFSSGGGASSSHGGGGGTTTSTTAGDGSSSSSSTTTAQPHPVNQVKVYVLNGGGPPGIAGTDTTALNSKGYVTVPVDNSPVKVSASVVYFVPGYDADAPAVATALGFAATAVQALPNPAPFDIQGANIVVILGPDAKAVG